MLRDAQVLPIWEGTTNIQSRLLRALADPRVEVLTVFLNRVDTALDAAAQASADWLAPVPGTAASSTSWTGFRL